MAIFKRLTCDACGRVRQVQSERPGGERCACGAKATKYSDKWWVDIIIGGERVRQPVAAKKDDARLYESSLRNKAASGEITGRPKEITLKEAMPVFEAWCRLQVENGNMDIKTMSRYLSSLNTHVLPALRHVNIARIDHVEVDSYVESRKAKRPAPATINRELTALSRLLTVCVRKRMLPANPMADYPKLSEPKTRDRALSQVEIAALLEACRHASAPDYLEIVVLVALHTGLRKEGVLGLKWEHIDWKGNGITRSVKRGKVVHIPMSETLRSALMAWRQRKAINIGGWVFPSPKKPMQPMLVSSNIGFEAAVKRAGLGDFVFHQLRHCFLSHLIMQTKDIQLAADIAGHTTMWITQRYTHLLDDHKQKAMKGFAYE